jgi:cytidylate kinase
MAACTQRALRAVPSVVPHQFFAPRLVPLIDLGSLHYTTATPLVKAPVDATGMGRQLFRIAIDGPAASGKSSTARALAARLGFDYVDTGAMYRTITLLAQRHGLKAEEDLDAIQKLTAAARFKFTLEPVDAKTLRPPQLRVTVNEEDVTELIRGPEITRAVADIAKQPSIRSLLLEKQRAFANTDLASSGADAKGLVIDGRDIGSVVFPDAELKVFLTAQLETRAARRLREYLKTQPSAVDSEDALQKIMNDIEARDRADRERAVSPLVQAPDAILIDTSNMSFTEQVLAIEQIARSRMSQS